ncbi:MAG: GNAT family N-acetyltransferase [Bacteroidales bacterium]|nr:GNAT family N-acetyltransferase [Bacteroidales bacterium]
MELVFIRFKALESVWKGMEGAARWPFVYWDYLRYIVRDGRWNPFTHDRMACVREGTSIRMIVPLRRYGRTWRMLGDEPGCDIADALFQPGLDPEKAGTCVRFFLDRMEGRLKLGRIPDGSLFLEAIPRERIHSDKTVVYVNIPVPKRWDDYLPSLSTNARQNVRKAYHRMEKDGIAYRLELYAPLCKPLPGKVWKQMMRTYCRRRIGKYRKGVFSDETKGGIVIQTLKYLHYVTLKCLWFCTKHDARSLRKEPNALHFVLWDGDRIMAFMSGFLTDDKATYSVPRIAINDGYRFYSPGCILVAETLKCLTGSLVRNLDLSRGDEPYKFKMGGVEYHTHDLVLR